MEHAAAEAAHPGANVAGWADEAFAGLAALPDVRRVGLALVEGGGRRLRFTASDRDRGHEVAWCHVDAYDDVPLNTAVRTGAPVIGSIEDLADRYADFAAAQRGTATVALAAVPVVAGDDVLGGYVLFYDRSQPFDDAQCRVLADLGRRLGSDLLRAHGPGERPPADRSATPGALVAVHEVPGDRAAVGPARQFLRRTLVDWRLDDESVDTATLCLSELVTNAVIHAHGGCVVRVELRDGALTVSVRDSGVAAAAAVEPVADPLQVHGRGLQLVDALATRWGYDLDGGGAAVWFALDRA